MNIKEAKQEVINTVKAYLQKDETGAYRIPMEKQRPLFLLGVPGIGKTAIMEQIAEELKLNLVSYTITHHTRQSTIGLPYISKKEYGGEEYSVTEYTMSEIIAAIYESIERSGISEGILFLDEINCVSETLAPTMLQFLQYKTFGMHRIPEGFLIVTAGNPPEYNKSVRDFDIATLDRVRSIKVEEDFRVWKEYAYQAGIHGAILAYLEIKKDHFYRVQQEIEGKSFVTARGWEDLSRILQVYEDMKLPVTEELVSEYIRDREIARDFTLYYELYQKYRNVYRIPDIFRGHYPEDTTAILSSPFDEKLSLLSLLTDGLNREFRSYAENQEVHREVFAVLKAIKESPEMSESREESAGERGKAGETEISEILHHSIEKVRQEIKRKKKAKLLSRREERIQQLAISMLEEMEKALRLEKTVEFDFLRAAFSEKERLRQEQIRESGEHLSHALEFIRRTFGEGQEMLLFLSELSSSYYSLKFVSEVGNEDYYHYNEYLLLQDKKSELRREIREAMKL